MSYPKHITVHPEAFNVQLPEPHVVSYLADASGRPITKATRANAFFIKTEIFECDGDAWSRWYDLVNAVDPDNKPLFISCQDSRGESIV